MLCRRFISIWVCLLVAGSTAGQSYCPANIGFENGSFTGWQCLSGTIDVTGKINMNPSSPVLDRHTIYKNASPQQKDKYGGFPVNCPNGSNYSIRLGNDKGLAYADGVTYTFTVPAGQNDYSIIFNYAVVLQNPQHLDYQQPRFTSKVFDVSANKYLDCGSFQFIASASLPGFKESSVEKNIFYKDWAPVTVKLAGLAGKTIRLEFTANACTQQVHFGYAYLDVDENCTTPITGNTYCNGSGAVVLKAPYGFKEYRWYDDQANILGTGNTLRLDPPPPNNTHYRLEIVPFPEQGCQDTLNTNIIASSDFMKLQVVDTVRGCASPGTDITVGAVTAGSTAGLSFEYFTDSTLAEFLSDPFGITKSGTYYIRASAPSGCTELKPVYALARKPPALALKQPEAVCTPATINLTDPQVTSGSEPGLIFSYWQDTAATVSVQNPQTISATGKYFVKGVNADGCSTVLPITATITDPPKVVLNDVHSCGELVFSSANPTAGSESGTQFSFWLDASASVPVTASQVISATTTVYAKAIGSSGCALIKPFDVNIHPFPGFTTTDPPPTTRPATVDLASTFPSNAAWSYSYWLDVNATKAIAFPHDVALTGTYYIKATDNYGCGTVDTVNVQIIDPPIIPPNVFSPNGDGVNDSWQIPILSAYSSCFVEVFSRSGRVVFRSVGYNNPWDGNLNGKPVPVDTYFYIIRLTPDKPSVGGSVTIVR